MKSSQWSYVCRCAVAPLSEKGHLLSSNLEHLLHNIMADEDSKEERYVELNKFSVVTQSVCGL